MSVIEEENQQQGGSSRQVGSSNNSNTCSKGNSSTWSSGSTSSGSSYERGMHTWLVAATLAHSSGQRVRRSASDRTLAGEANGGKEVITERQNTGRRGGADDRSRKRETDTKRNGTRYEGYRQSRRLREKHGQGYGQGYVKRERRVETKRR